MPVDPSDGSAGTEHRHPGRRAALRWVLAVALAVTTVVAAVMVAGSHAPPTRAGGRPPERTATPVLSLRRALDPLADTAAEQRLLGGLDAFVAAQPADTCLQVRVGDIAYDHRSDDPQSPASVQKLFTAVAALTGLGPDETFTTEVLGTSPPVDGVVQGDLFLRGGGDPLLATGEYMARERNQPQIFTDIARLADAVVAAGVRGVSGAVVGDESRYDTERYPPIWPSRFMAQRAVGPLSALSLNDGFAYFPEAQGAFGPAPDPAAYAAEMLARELRERGVLVLSARSGPAPAGAVPVATVQSPPVQEVVEQMLVESDNNTAELLTKELGRRRSGAGTTAAGVEAIETILAAEGLDVDAIDVADGSGLAVEDVVTCALVGDLLTHGSTAEALARSLPVAGERGTLASRFTAPELVGRIRAKTGTLNTVTALAGVAQTAAGPGTDARFVVVANVEPPRRMPIEAVAAQEDLVALLVAYPDRPELSSLAPR